MTLYVILVIVLGIAGTLLLGAMQARTDGRWRRFGFEASALLAIAVLLNRLFGFPSPVEGAVAKGTENDLVVSVVLFAFMVLGMVAQAAYRHLSLPRAQRRRYKLDWATLLAPVCASPIIFMPLMVALQSADVDLRALTAPRIMIFLVAFQNGFFWKEHFDRRALEAREGKA